jgi:ribonuclease-3
VHNERLEFLGDAVLNLVVSQTIFARFPEAREGRLTELKAFLVARNTLEEVAQRLGLAGEIRTGGGLENRGSLPRSLLGNALEAILGAIFLDSENQNQTGLNVSKRVVLKWLAPEFESIEDRQIRRAAKQELQAFAQRKFGTLPSYEVVDHFDHPETKAFKVSARIGNRSFVGAWGTTKRDAERLAAWEAWLELTGAETHAD